MVTQDEAQSSQVKAQSNPAAEPYGVSRANDQILEVLTEKGFGTPSRMRRRPAWMDDYVWAKGISAGRGFRGKENSNQVC